MSWQLLFPVVELLLLSKINSSTIYINRYYARACLLKKNIKFIFCKSQVLTKLYFFWQYIFIIYVFFFFYRPVKIINNDSWQIALLQALKKRKKHLCVTTITRQLVCQYYLCALYIVVNVKTRFFDGCFRNGLYNCSLLCT